MSNKKLIINADDFGYTPAVTQGIIEAHKRGVLLQQPHYQLLLIF
ncbi:ChbG/HpnK family deacetylase [Enterococcus faecalis]|nr:ChbG/HpnK family deacetylase [Enterococcus faecalis]MDK4422316.1 ChbG/HpnK family deacetylase [Enterococcus faecalis]MDK4425000.1 ChbG/HpnK family deacetylase [Enterococcus faecalis]